VKSVPRVTDALAAIIVKLVSEPVPCNFSSAPAVSTALGVPVTSSTNACEPMGVDRAATPDGVVAVPNTTAYCVSGSQLDSSSAPDSEEEPHVKPPPTASALVPVNTQAPATVTALVVAPRALSNTSDTPETMGPLRLREKRSRIVREAPDPPPVTVGRVMSDTAVDVSAAVVAASSSRVAPEANAKDDDTVSS
jgi:hypothetical protein